MTIQSLSNLPYDSFKMLDNKGNFMCFTSRKRALWYYNRQLATLSLQDNSFQLNFEPNGKGKENDIYYSQPVDNRCVVCGNDKISELTKHHVVPYVFRSRFSNKFKIRNNHDILPVCVDCHEKYEFFATQYKQALAKAVGSTLNQTRRSSQEQYNHKIISARNAIRKAQEGLFTIPPSRLATLEKIASKELLKLTDNQEIFWADAILKPLQTEKELHQFMVSWRKHFIQYAKPSYLPQHWDVNKFESINK